MADERDKYLGHYEDATQFLDAVNTQIYHALQSCADSTFVHQHLLGNKFAGPAHALSEGRITRDEFLQAVEQANSFLRAYKLADITIDTLRQHYPWLVKHFG
jgi:hypothetical protein